jgi:serine protein kinase
VDAHCSTRRIAFTGNPQQEGDGQNMKPSEFLKQAEELRQSEQSLYWEGTFADYLEIVTKNPQVADLAHARVYDMIMAAGVDEPEGRPKQYRFFRSEIFGLDKTLQQIVEEYFAPAADGWMCASAS